MIFNNYNLIIKLILKKIEELLSRDFNAAKDQIRERRIEFFDLTLLLCNSYFRKCSKWIMCPYVIKYKSSKSISKIVNEFKMILSSFLKHCKFVAQCKERNFLYGGYCFKKKFNWKNVALSQMNYDDNTKKSFSNVNNVIYNSQWLGENNVVLSSSINRSFSF